MTRWTRINLLLALLAGVLATLLSWPGDGPVDGDRLTDLAPERITTVRVERARRLSLALQRDAGNWRLTHPRDAAADGRRVNQLLAIALARVTQRFPVDGDDARFGTAAPAAVLQLNDRRLAFGARDPTQRSRYVRVGDEICVIDDLYFNLLTLPAKHFVVD